MTHHTNNVIDIQLGQFCVVGSRYSNHHRVVRADKLTPKQVKTLRWGTSYDITARDLVLFAGSEAEAEQKAERANALAAEFGNNKSAAEAECREKCTPFTAARDAQIETFRANYAELRRALFCQTEAA